MRHLHLRLAVAILAARLAATASRRLGRSGGTVLPGHIAHRIAPAAARQIALEIPEGIVLVTGTNGKTTSARMLAQIAVGHGWTPIHNRSGANLMSGVRSALLLQADILGRPTGDLGIFEVDEANLPAATAALQPRVVVLTNVFRDQLDRYGEVDHIVETWRHAVRSLPATCTLVLNADDPTVAQLADLAPGPILLYGLEHRQSGTPGLAHEADRRLCPRCGARLQYAWTYYGHVGHYACLDCGWKRPTAEVTATAVHEAPSGSTITMQVNGRSLEVRLPLPGAYNVYNALAATAAAQALGCTIGEIGQALATLTAVFGRQEVIPLGNGSVTITLVKNPVGFNQVLRTLAQGAITTHLVLAINDEFADGTDVSWLWDVDFETLTTTSSNIVCTGLRAHDMAVRLKYAGIPQERVLIEAQLDSAVRDAVTQAQGGAHVTILPTYTAMLTVRQQLQKLGCVPPFWET